MTVFVYLSFIWFHHDWIEIDTSILVTVVSLTTWEAHHSTRASPLGCGELPRSLMGQQWPQYWYQFLYPPWVILAGPVQNIYGLISISASYAHRHWFTWNWPIKMGYGLTIFMLNFLSPTKELGEGGGQGVTPAMDLFIRPSICHTFFHISGQTTQEIDCKPTHFHIQGVTILSAYLSIFIIKGTHG